MISHHLGVFTRGHAVEEVGQLGVDGEQDNWDEYDQTMRDQTRTAVLVAPDQIGGNH